MPRRFSSARDDIRPRSRHPTWRPRCKAKGVAARLPSAASARFRPRPRTDRVRCGSRAGRREPRARPTWGIMHTYLGRWARAADGPGPPGLLVSALCLGSLSRLAVSARRLGPGESRARLPPDAAVPYGLSLRLSLRLKPRAAEPKPLRAPYSTEPRPSPRGAIGIGIGICDCVLHPRAPSVRARPARAAHAPLPTGGALVFPVLSAVPKRDPETLRTWQTCEASSGGRVPRKTRCSVCTARLPLPDIWTARDGSDARELTRTGGNGERARSRLETNGYYRRGSLPARGGPLRSAGGWGRVRDGRLRPSSEVWPGAIAYRETRRQGGTSRLGIGGL
ncbi:unnamed protein product [Diplocarpon coronariae]